MRTISLRSSTSIWDSATLQARSHGKDLNIAGKPIKLGFVGLPPMVAGEIYGGQGRDRAALAAQDSLQVREGEEGIQQREIHVDLGRERSSVWEEGSTPRGSWRRRDSGRDTKIGGWLGLPRLPRDPARREGLALRSDDPPRPSARRLASASGFLHHRRRSGRDAGTARQTRLAARFDWAGGCT